MQFINNEQYMEDVRRTAALDLPWEKLQGSSVFLSGGTGLMGSCLADVLMLKNREEELCCDIYILSRSRKKAAERFSVYMDSDLFHIAETDVNEPILLSDVKKAGYVLHLASNTHPLAYANDPIGTITTNIIGAKNMLDFADTHGAERVLFASSNEIYGENRGDAELFAENYCGYIDCNTMRAGYPESKRCAEALCQAYIRQKHMDVVIARLTRSYGPTMLMTDTKAISQFIRKAIAGEDIVLKSAGTQFYSYTYVTDAVAGLLTILLKGDCGEAYNIADESSDIMLKDLAALIAGEAGKEVVFELPDQVESAGYSKATKARLDGTKLKALGWKPVYDIQNGISRTVRIFGEMNQV